MESAEPEQADQIRREVSRRIDQITSSPGAILRWDQDGDGMVDADEMSMMRAAVERDVVAEFEQSELGDEPTDEMFDDWSPAQEVVDPFEGVPVIEAIDGRYEVLERVGHGGQGTTYLARAAGGTYVALKELRFGDLDSWKAVELFEREAEALASLEHPRIPTFVDSFQVDTTDSVRFFLVQEFVRGEPLDALLARGERFSRDEVIEVARNVLSVLTYLHAMRPPMVHRDIKPANLIRRDAGGYALVDFGAVQLVDVGPVGGSTVVGTTGYMPPEQLAGRATPQSDLYALGATLIHVVTGVHPSKLETARLKLQWRDRSRAGRALEELIDEMIEPVIDDRPASAQAALRALDELPAAPRMAADDAPLQTTTPTTLPAARRRLRRDLISGERRELDKLLRGLKNAWIDDDDQLVIESSSQISGEAFAGILAAGFGIGAIGFLRESAEIFVFGLGFVVFAVSTLFSSGKLTVEPGGRFELTGTSGGPYSGQLSYATIGEDSALTLHLSAGATLPFGNRLNNDVAVRMAGAVNVMTGNDGEAAAAR